MNRLLLALARLQIAQPLAFILLAIALTLISALPISRLSLNSDLTALLPESMPSVRDLGEITHRFGAPQTLTLLVTSKDPKANRRFVSDVVPKLGELGASVLSIDWNIRAYGDFIRRNLLLFADATELVELRNSLAERIEDAKTAANPFFVSLEAKPPERVESIIERVRARHHADRKREQRLVDGYFEHPDGQSVAVFLRTSIRGGDSGQMEALLASAAAILNKAEPHRYAPDMKVEYGGGVLDMYTEKSALEDAALLATLITLVLVAAVVILFFRRWRSVPILFLGIVPPIALTFAFARLSVGFLNTSSAFLSAIVIGNGINPHVIWLARYFEARRAGQNPGNAITEAHLATWPGTLSASLAAAVAYASLMLTDFRAFRDFGIIGGMGMVLCWLATFLWTPVLALLWERLGPIRAGSGRAEGTLIGVLVERLALGRPRLMIAMALVVTAGSAVAVARWAAADPIEYDFRNLQSQRYDSPLQVINRRIAGSVDETTNGSAIAVLVRSPKDMPHVLTQLEALAHRTPDALGAVRSIYDLLPKDQERKLPLIAEIRKLMLEARPHLNPADQAELDRHLPAADLRVVSAADLPDTVARPFIERDGNRGSIAYVEHNLTQNQFDGRYLVRWADAARSPTNLDGTRVAVAGAAPVVADLVKAIVRSGPKVVALSFFATLGLLIFTFRRTRDRLFTLSSHLIGVLWMVGGLAAFGVKINFLNFVALPVTFGLGVDYGVNVMRRVVEEEGRLAPLEAVRNAIRETGGAVILCSLTTLIGYISLFTSPNRAVNSFGIAMSLSEVTCVASAVLVLPAVLKLWLGRRGAGAATR